MSSTTLQTFDLAPVNSRSSTECQSNPHSGHSESFDVVRFDLGPLLRGQTRIAKLKSAYNSLIIGPRGLGW